MIIKFNCDRIVTENYEIIYSDFKKDDGYLKLIELLKICVINEGTLKFECEENCPPFGKKLKSILETEFVN